MYPHRIRLLGPWDCEPLVRHGDGSLPAKFTMTMPCRWGERGLSDFAGKVRFRRRFSWPGRLDAHEHLWLTFQGVEGRAEIALNGQPVIQTEYSTGTLEFEITSLVKARNELIAILEADSDRGGLWGEVALEVRCPAFLRNVQCQKFIEHAQSRLRLAGEVVGTHDRPLELYVLWNRRTILYHTIETAAGGKAFDLTTEPLPIEVQRDLPQTENENLVTLDLVDGGIIWYRWETVIEQPG
jgi:glycosyl hydrolase family 2